MADSDPWQQAALRIAATGIGAAIAGPIGAAIGPFLGIQIGKGAVDLIAAFGNDATKETATRAADFCYGQFAQAVPAPGLEAAFRDALREALGNVHSGIDALTLHAKPEWKQWFSLWDQRLKEPASADAVADLKKIPQLPDEQAAYLQNLFQSTMERLAAEQRASNVNSLSLNGHHRSLDAELLAILRDRLPAPLQTRYNFHVDRTPVAVAEANRIVQQLQTSLLSSIAQQTSQIAQDTLHIPEVLVILKQIQSAQNKGDISPSEAEKLRAERDQLAEELRKYKESVAIGAEADPAEAPFAALVKNNDLDAAEKLKLDKIQSGWANIQSGRAKIARDFFDLGRVRELKFDWPGAIDAYASAWDIEKNFDFGFQYAYLCQRQNRFRIALPIYETVLLSVPSLEHRGRTLNNLANLYRDTQRMTKAEEAYDEALMNYRELAKANPEAYLPDVAMTRNNLANLYRDTQRMTKAEEAYGEALMNYRELAKANPEAYLPYVAMTLNNLAILYSATQRMAKAEEAFGEALKIRRQLAKENPEAYLPDVAGTLNNLANLYSDTQRMTKAEEAYGEALKIRRQLAKENPEAYLPDVAGTLNNLANLYSDTQRMTKAEEAYGEALKNYRELAKANPEAYLPDVAMTLNNLAILYRATQRMTKAEEAYGEALKNYRELAKANPEAYLPNVAMTLNNLANLYSDTQRMTKAEEMCREASEILEPLWNEQPELHGDQMARIAWTRADFLADPAAKLAMLHSAFAAAYDPQLKQGIQADINALSQ